MTATRSWTIHCDGCGESGGEFVASLDGRRHELFGSGWRVNIPGGRDLCPSCVTVRAVTTCRSCHAPIVWARTIADKAVPLDADGHGNPVIVDGGGLVAVHDTAHGLVVRGAHGERGYRTHFASCPNARTHRRS